MSTTANKNVETILSLVDLNKKKLSLLKEMSIYELNNQNNNKEYREKAYYYEIVHDVYEEKLKSISLIEREKLSESIIKLNGNLNVDGDIISLIKNDSKHQVLYKTILDLNPALLEVYKEPSLYGKETSLTTEEISGVLRTIGIDSELLDKSVINKYLVNKYMISDIVNIIYGTVENQLLIEKNQLNRISLIKLKYNLLFQFNPLELRALKDKFDLSKKPVLVDDYFIQNTGMSIFNYRKNFDKIISIMLCSFLRDLLKSDMQNIDSSDLSILTALANNIIYSDVCDRFRIELPVTIDLPVSIIKNINNIDEILDNSQISNQKIKK